MLDDGHSASLWSQTGPGRTLGNIACLFSGSLQGLVGPGAEVWRMDFGARCEGI